MNDRLSPTCSHRQGQLPWGPGAWRHGGGCGLGGQGASQPGSPQLLCPLRRDCGNPLAPWCPRTLAGAKRTLLGPAGSASWPSSQKQEPHFPARSLWCHSSWALTSRGWCWVLTMGARRAGHGQVTQLCGGWRSVPWQHLALWGLHKMVSVCCSAQCPGVVGACADEDENTPAPPTLPLPQRPPQGPGAPLGLLLSLTMAGQGMESQERAGRVSQDGDPRALCPAPHSAVWLPSGATPAAPRLEPVVSWEWP